jgi:hypothetical protein
MSIAQWFRAVACVWFVVAWRLAAAADAPGGWLLLFDLDGSRLVATDAVATDRFVQGRAAGGTAATTRVELRDATDRLLYAAPLALPTPDAVQHAGADAQRFAVRAPALAQATRIAIVDAAGTVLWSQPIDDAFRSSARRKAAAAADELDRASSAAGKASSDAITKLAALNEQRRRDARAAAAAADSRNPGGHPSQLDALRRAEAPNAPALRDKPVPVPSPAAVPTPDERASPKTIAAPTLTYRGRIVGEDGRPLGVPFQAEFQFGDATQYFTVDADGRYAVDITGATTLYLEAYPPLPYPYQTRFVSAAADGSIPDVSLARGWIIEGRLLAPDGTPASGSLTVQALQRDAFAASGEVENGNYRLAVRKNGIPVTLVADEISTPPLYLDARQSIGVVDGDRRVDLTFEAGITVLARPLADGLVPGDLNWNVDCFGNGETAWGSGIGPATVTLRVRPGTRYNCSMRADPPYLWSDADGIAFERGQVWHPALRRGKRVLLSFGGDAGPSWFGSGSTYADGEYMPLSATSADRYVTAPDGRAVMNFFPNDGLLSFAVGPRQFVDGEIVPVAPRRGATVTGRVTNQFTSSYDGYGTLNAYRAGDGVLVQSATVSPSGYYILALPLGTYDFKAEYFTETATEALHLAPVERRGIAVTGDTTVDIEMALPTRTLTIDRSVPGCLGLVRAEVQSRDGAGRDLGRQALGSKSDSCTNGVRTVRSVLKAPPGEYSVRLVLEGREATQWRNVDLRDADASIAFDSGPPRVWRPKLVDAHGRTVVFGGGDVYDRMSRGHTWLAPGNGAAPTIPLNDGRIVVLEPPPGTRLLPRQIALDTSAPLPDAIVFDELPATAGDGAVRTMLASTREDPVRVVFIGDGYAAERETFTDTNGNGVWDGYTWIDRNGNGVYDNDEQLDPHGDLMFNAPVGVDLRTVSEPFVDTNGDGVPSVDDASLFYANVETYLRDWFGADYWSQRRGDFEVKAAFLASPQAGMSVRRPDGTALVERRTLFDGTYYDTTGMIMLDRAKAMVAAERIMPGYDLVVVLVNEMPWSGRANATINTWPGSIVSNGGHYYAGYRTTPMAHEAGHALGWLGDEYVEHLGVNIVAEPLSPNVSGRATRGDVEWNDLVAADVPVPSTYAHDGIGVFPGADHYLGGAFRPSWNSIMRYGRFFDAVGRRALDARFAQLFRTPRAPPPGNWYDRRRAGHGIDLQLYQRDPDAGDLYFVVLYTYDESGKPEWYQALGRLSGATFVPLADPNGRTLTRIRGGAPGAPDRALSGDLSIDFAENAACRTDDRADALALASLRWSIGGKAALWCIEPAVTRASHATPDLSGHWYAPSDPGWGMEVTAIDDGNGAPTVIAFVYYVDADGRPRWASASSPDYVPGQPLVAYEADNGYCRTCTAPTTRTQAPIGRITLGLVEPLRESPAGGRNRVDIDITPPGAAAFRKADIAVSLLSEPLH